MKGNHQRDFDKEASSWDDNPGRLRMTNAIADAIIAEIRLSKDMDVLDFGSGTGIIAVRLSPLVHSVTAVDGSQGMLDVLQTKAKSFNLTNINTRRLDFEGEETLQGSFDVLVCSMTLHHIKEIGLLFSQFYKVLRPGGRLCIADLDSDGGQFHQNNEGVQHFGFDRAELRSILADAGFADIRDRTATEVLKPVAGGGMRSFSLFLTTGLKVRPGQPRDNK